MNSFISDLEKIIKEIKTEFNVYKENNELEIQLSKDLINIYELKKKEYNLNYQIIQNVKNISFNNNINFEYNMNEIKNNLCSQFKSYFIDIKNSIELEYKWDIICEYNINQYELNKEIQILNYFEEAKKIYLENLPGINNEKEIKENCELYINDNKINFCNKYKFIKEGKNIIKIKCKKYLTNISYMFYNCTNLLI